MENFEDSGRQYPISFKEKIGLAIGIALCLASAAGFAITLAIYL